MGKSNLKCEFGLALCKSFLSTNTEKSDAYSKPVSIGQPIQTVEVFGQQVPKQLRKGKTRTP